jgi:lipopolysaccharide export system permease protein
MPEQVYAHKIYRDSIASLPYAQHTRPGVDAKPDSVTVSKSDTTASKSLVKGMKLSESKADSANVVSVAPTPAKEPKPRTVTSRKAGRPKMRKVKPIVIDARQRAKVDSIYNMALTRDMIQGAANKARTLKSQLTNANDGLSNFKTELVIFDIQWHKILASSFACIAMFLIGAPLGAIIKKGGLGVPFLVSILFFIVYYVISMQGEKLAKAHTVSVIVGVWLSDVVLFTIGLLFLRQARRDARLFEADFYSVLLDKIKRRFFKRAKPVAASTV